MEDWKKEIELIKNEEQKFSEIKRKEAKEKQEKKEHASKAFIGVIRPYLEQVVATFQEKDSRFPRIEEYVDMPMGNSVQKFDIVLLMDSEGNGLYLKVFEGETANYFTANGINYFEDKGKRYRSDGIITVDKPDSAGNTVFVLKDDHIKEAIKKFLRAYYGKRTERKSNS